MSTHFLGSTKQTKQGGFNLGGTNATSRVPNITGNYGLIDLDTTMTVTSSGELVIKPTLCIRSMLTSIPFQRVPLPLAFPPFLHNLASRERQTNGANS